jgi:hypothetical protein
MPKWLYCWRCKMEFPMLYKNEARYVFKERRSDERNLESGELILKRYFEITGFDEINPNAVWHHIIAQHGSPCSKCGKPLRTPRAKWCAACGAFVKPPLPIS